MTISIFRGSYSNSMQAGTATKSGTTSASTNDTSSQVSSNSTASFAEALQAAANAASTSTTNSQPSTQTTTTLPSNTDIGGKLATEKGSLHISDADLQQMNAYYNRTLPQDIIDEAKARLAAKQRLGECRIAVGMDTLPILPENRALVDQIKQEERAAYAADADGVMDVTPYWHLLMAVQQEGWKRPMTMADARREVDITTAMWRLTPPISKEESDYGWTMVDQHRQGNIPDVWKQRWQQEGLPMPEIKLSEFSRSMWQELAQAAGISDNEFLAKAREFAGKYPEDGYIKAIEQFISQRYSSNTAQAAA
jgi:hypothetical protein